MVLGMRMQFKNQTEARAAQSSELDALKTQLQEVQAQLDAALTEAKAAKACTQTVEDEVAALRGRLAEMLVAKQEAERSLTQTRLDLDAAGSAAAEERTRHGSALASLQAAHTQEIVRLREELAGNEQVQQRFENDLKQRSIALAEATAARKAAENAAHTRTDQTREMQQLKAATDAAAKSQASAEAERGRLQTELEQQRERVAGQAVELLKKEKELDGKHEELKAALEDARQQNARADSLELRAAEADQLMKQAKDEADTLARKLDEANTSLGAERRALEEERSVSSMSQREARDACDEAAQLVAVTKAAEAEWRMAKESAIKDSEEMSRKLEVANAEATDLRQQREALQQQLKTSYDEAAQRTETINQLEEELKKYRAEAAAVNPAHLLLLHDKGREVEQLKKERESISNELERLQLGIAWESTTEADVDVPKDMIFNIECPVKEPKRPSSRGHEYLECPVKSPKRPHSRGPGRPRGPRPSSARRSNHAAKRTPSLPGKAKAADPSPRSWNSGRAGTPTIYESGTLERISND